MNMKGEMSNKWNFMIDLDKEKESENVQLNKVNIFKKFTL